MDKKEIIPTEDSREFARYIRDTLNGNQPEILHYYDSADEYHIPIIKVKDSPIPKVTSLSTLGLYNTPIYIDNVEQSYRYEILMAGDDGFPFLENIISTLAFFVIKDKYPIGPGTLINNIIELYDAQSSIKALLFSPPFSWNLNTKKQVDGLDVYFLQAIPLTDYDLTRIKEIGWNNLLEFDFPSREIDIFDFNRKL